MASEHPDRNLLFGILSVQMDFVSRDALIQAMHAWVLDKTKPLGRLLVEQGALRPEDYELLEPMVQRHIERHQQDPKQSLAAISSASSLQQGLRQIADSDVQQSLNLLSQDAELESIEATTDVRTPEPGHRYRVLHRHAQGGLGTVFVAYDEELHREVALKEIQAQHADSSASRARFLQEAEITGNLEHPGVVPVYGLGQYADGRPFYAMRFIKGDSLREATRRFHEQAAAAGAEWRRVELRRLLGRFIDVCDAIGYAHSRGVLHRDLKPGNIMIGKYGETLVVDWGLAKLIGDTDEQHRSETALKIESDASPVETLPGSAVGTPSYMSPEQAAGQKEQLSEAADIYSLGATLYYILTCQPPVTGTTTQETLENVRLGNVVPPRSIKPDVPRPLEAICLKALARTPARRYASCRDLAHDVEAWLASTPVSAYHGVIYRTTIWLRRHRTAAVATVLVLACLMAFAGFMEVRRQKTARQIQNHFQQARWAVEAGNLENGLAELSAVRALADSMPDQARRAERWLQQLQDYRDFEARYDAIRLGVSEMPKLPPGLADEPEMSPPDDVVAQHAEAALQALDVQDNATWLKRFDGALLNETQLASLKAHVGETLVQLALRVAREWNDDDESRARTVTALGLLDEATQYLEFGKGLHSLRARWHRRLGDDDQAEASWDKALAAAKSGDAERFSVFDQYVFAEVVASMFVRSGNEVRSIDEVLANYEAVLERDPQFFRAHFGLYSVYAKAGDVTGQLRHLEACLALSPRDPNLYYFRGMLFFSQGGSDPQNYARARSDFSAAVRCDPDFAKGYYYRGRMNVVLSDWKAAVQDFDLAIARDPQMNGPLWWRAIGRAKSGMHQEAVADADEAVRREPDDRLVLYYAARAYAQAVAAVGASVLAAEERTHLQNTYAQRCIELLNQAFGVGFDDVGRLVPGGDFTPVYGAADIQTAIRQHCEQLLAAPAKTADKEQGETRRRRPPPRRELLLVMGDLAKSESQWEAALDWYRQSQAAYLEAAKQKELTSGEIPDLRRAMIGCVLMLERLEQYDEAESAFHKLLALQSRAEPLLRIERAVGLLDAGRYPRAVAVVESLEVAELGSGIDLYDLACVYGRALGLLNQDTELDGGEKTTRGTEYATRAIACLRSAQTRKFFQQRDRLERLRTDPDLDPLRAQPEFPTLLTEIQADAGPGDDSAAPAAESDK